MLSKCGNSSVVGTVVHFQMLIPTKHTAQYNNPFTIMYSSSRQMDLPLYTHVQNSSCDWLHIISLVMEWRFTVFCH